jgi:hypothetical protein
MSHIPEHPTIAHNGVVVDVNDLLDHAEFHSRPHRAVIRVYDAGFPSPRVSTCNAGRRRLGPSSLPPAADKLPMWAPL